MARVKGGYVTRQRRKRTIKLAKGNYREKSISFKVVSILESMGTFFAPEDIGLAYNQIAIVPKP